MINVDIEKCFDKINYDLLLVKSSDYMSELICESSGKFYKAGYIQIGFIVDFSSKKEGTL